MSRFTLQYEFPDAGQTGDGMLPAAQLLDVVRIAQDGAALPRVAPLVVSVRDAGGNAVGGLMASTFGEWLMLQMLWLPEEARARGYGRRLLVMAEEEAGRRGCRHAYVDGADRVLVPFFERCGYVAGVLDTPAVPGAGQPFRLSKTLTLAGLAAQ